MKRVIFRMAIVFMAILLTNCTGHVEVSTSTSKPKNKPKEPTNYYVDIDEFTIDGCQYLLGYRWGAHKGNCNNPIHKENERD